MGAIVTLVSVVALVLLVLIVLLRETDDEWIQEYALDEQFLFLYNESIYCQHEEDRTIVADDVGQRINNHQFIYLCGWPSSSKPAQANILIMRGR